MGEADRRAERVELPFALEHAGFHLGLVIRMFGARDGVAIEGICEGIEEDAGGLPLDHPAQQ